MPIFSWIFLVALVTATGLQIWLILRHRNHVKQHRAVVPKEFEQQISLDNHQIAADYTLDKTKVSMIELLIGTGLLLIWTLGGGLQWMDQLWRRLEWNPIYTGIAVLLSVSIISSVLDIPFSLYRTFVIEQKFGFNRSTPSLFVKDFIKQTLLSLAIGIPLLGLVLWLMQAMGDYWWLYVWAVIIGFSLLANWLYPIFIAPLFNKFTPLEDGTLKQRIQDLLSSCGFQSKGIFIMDGSKRSGHGNAYFTGFGQQKRIVFYDTLIENLSPDEIEAVLAHELGHFKRRHIRKRLISTSVITFASLALLAWLRQQDWFFTGLGVAEPSIYMALLLFSMIFPVFGIYLQPLFSLLMRKHEFEADEFAVQQTKAEALIQALVKLYQENASTLTPDPLFSAFHDSHPPASIRIAHIQQVAHA